MNKHTICAVLTAICIALPGVAAAEDAVDRAGRAVHTREVVYNDLDLATPAGVDALDRRIVLAVRSVCGSADLRDLRASADMLRCRREASAFAAKGRELAVASHSRREGVAMLTVRKPLGAN